MNLLVTILLAVLIFGVIIIIHELGHFLTAKAAGVAVPEFSIGMGPKLFQIKHNKQTTPSGCCRLAAMWQWKGRMRKATTSGRSAIKSRCKRFWSSQQERR